MVKEKSEIRECNIHGITVFHNFSDGKSRRWRCGKCASSAVTKRRREVKKMAVEYKGGCCSICGYGKSVWAIDFHHTDPTKKDFSIGKSGATRSWEKTKLELDKCIAVCRNCHAELHEKEELEKQMSLGKDILAEKPITRLSAVEKVCKECEHIFKTFEKNQVYCSNKCNGKAKRVVKNRPSKEELSELINNNSWVFIGRKYGVTDNAIKKWARSYKLI